jgi:preprotein translocase subunit SecE
VSDEKPGREGDPRDAELTDEQLDREAPGVDDAAELEAAEDEIAAEAESDEDKVVAAPTRRRQGRITADDDEDDDEAGLTRSRRPASSRPAGREGSGTRSRAAAERARAESGKKRSLARFLREVVAELRKVIWPGRRELITYTTVVIVFVAFMVALVAGLDLLFAKGVIAVFG